jgi:hypothetical protein
MISTLSGVWVSTALCAVINFAPLAQPGAGFNNVGGVLVQDGFQFTSSLSMLAAWQNSSPNHPVGGVPATSLTEFFATGQTTMTQVGGAPFDLLGIDLAGYSTLGSGPFSVTFTGTKSDSSIVQQTFSPLNANGFQPVLQPFSFNSNFTGLVSVTFTQGFNGTNAYQFNNIIVNAFELPSNSHFSRLPNGDFELGNLTGWTASGINDGGAVVVGEGDQYSFFNSTGVTLNGDYAANVRSSGPAPPTSMGILTSDPFIATDALRFSALTETDMGNSNPVLFEVRILDTNSQILLSQIVHANLLEAGPDPADAPFSTHILNTSAFRGQTVVVQFRQNTLTPGSGFFTLVDDVGILVPEPSTRLSVSILLAIIGIVTNRARLV